MTRGEVFIERARQQGRRAAFEGRTRQDCHWCYILRAINYSPVYKDDLRKDVDFQDHIFAAFYDAYYNAFKKGGTRGPVSRNHQGR